MSDKLISEFLISSESSNFNFKLTPRSEIKYSPLENDALFHLPFLAMAILAICKNRKYQPETGSIGEIMGIVFERTFVAFKSSKQMLSWSANLRARIVKAIIFLETAQLANVSDKHIISTQIGKRLINKVFVESTPLGLAIRGIERNYRDLMEEIQMRKSK
ncbi:TPA: hypothetical protein ACT9A3_002998 [Legionella pneumophila]|nr:hypothetical protein [Legionella pneumophila]HAU0884398.1 hypothetical protein [Legionella pneumophila]HDO7950401.1 hypothetical protein [Legionella pneumophila]HDO7953351.1 hypothetical protein [Legionella pneumophila]HDO8180278.1 hypothetical protein [Legionella pneumophila]